MSIVPWILICAFVIGPALIGLSLYYWLVAGDARLGDEMLWDGAILLIVILVIGGFCLAPVKVWILEKQAVTEKI